jgi:hypothetical protein
MQERGGTHGAPAVYWGDTRTGAGPHFRPRLRACSPCSPRAPLFWSDSPISSLWSILTSSDDREIDVQWRPDGTRISFRHRRWTEGEDSRDSWTWALPVE